MDDRNLIEYYCAREQQARSLAAAAVDPAVATIHLEMAARYAELIGGVAPVLVIVLQETPGAQQPTLN